MIGLTANCDEILIANCVTSQLLAQTDSEVTCRYLYAIVPTLAGQFKTSAENVTRYCLFNRTNAVLVTASSISNAIRASARNRSFRRVGATRRLVLQRYATCFGDCHGIIKS